MTCDCGDDQYIKASFIKGILWGDLLFTSTDMVRIGLILVFIKIC